MNMPHCRFTNTLEALRECYDYLGDGPDPFADLSAPEKRAAKKLIVLCGVVGSEYGDEASHFIEHKP